MFLSEKLLYLSLKKGWDGLKILRAGVGWLFSFFFNLIAADWPLQEVCGCLRVTCLSTGVSVHSLLKTHEGIKGSSGSSGSRGLQELF